jgi:hypothetical protein
MAQITLELDDEAAIEAAKIDDSEHPNVLAQPQK